MDPLSSPRSPSLLILVVAVLLCVGLSITLAQHLPLPWSLAVAEGGLLPPLLWWQGTRARGVTNRLSPCEWLWYVGRSVAGGLLLGTGCAVVVSIWVHPWVTRWMTSAETQQLWMWIKPATGWRPLWVDMLCWAVIPACAEELLWRGLLLHVTRSTTRRQTLLLWLLTSLLFAVLHGSWARLVPTLLLGLCLGAAALRSRSLLLCVMAHGMYNAGVLLLTRSGVSFTQLSTSCRLALTAVAIGLGSWVALSQPMAIPTCLRKAR